MEIMPLSSFKKELSKPLQAAIRIAVDAALAEDIGTGDLTASLIDAKQSAKATIISREAAILCGIPWASYCLQKVSAEIHCDWHADEGEQLIAGQTICSLQGSARALLTAERCILNFLQTLSATATQTHQYVQAVAGTGTRICDTRKTLPGLRLAQKYAVTVGGGDNQRMGLYDGILIKENHIAAAGGIKQVLTMASGLGAGVPIQIEVETLSQLEEAIAAGATLVLLDNFDLPDLIAAVKLTAGRAILEASGGITIENVREIALTGVDRISIGSLTKNINSIDLSMRFIE